MALICLPVKSAINKEQWPLHRFRLPLFGSRLAVIRIKGLQLRARRHYAVLVDEHGVSSARLYWENHYGLYNTLNISIPAAVSVFPGENYEAARSWAEQAYHNLIYYNKVDRGGHYAEWEQPQLFSEEVRAGLRPLRKLN